MRFKNTNDTKYFVDFFRETEDFMLDVTVKEFIEFLNNNPRCEHYDNDDTYLDGHIVKIKCYMVHESKDYRREFFTTPDNRLFYWRSNIQKCELVD